MADKLFLRATTAYEAPSKRLQNDIEITGASVTRSGGRITSISFGGGGAGATTWVDANGDTWAIMGITTTGALITNKI